MGCCLVAGHFGGMFLRFLALLEMLTTFRTLLEAVELKRISVGIGRLYGDFSTRRPFKTGLIRLKSARFRSV